MATALGYLVTAIGAKMAATFPTFRVIYGLPSVDGDWGGMGDTVRVHCMQDRGTMSGSQVGGIVVTAPLISITVSRNFSADATLLATHLASLDMAADLRLAVNDLIMDNLLGSDPIEGLEGQALWVTGYTMTPAMLAELTESVTAEFEFNLSSTYGGR